MKLFIIAVIIGMSSFSQADTYTILTSPEQEQALAHVVSEYNKTQLLTDPTTLPVLQSVYLQQVMNSIFENYRRQLQEAEVVQAQQMKKQYDTASDAVKRQIDSLLGKSVQ
jgi:hypothetical protein